MSKVRSITPKDPADFTPELGNYKTLQPFRYWCQKVLPLVYDDSLSYYELLCKVVDYLNKTMEDVETLHGDVTNLHTAYDELQSYVNNYFSTLDVQEEINNKLDNMASSGELYEIIRKYTDPIVNEQDEKINALKVRIDTFTTKVFENVGSMKADLTLSDNIKCRTMGYYSINDGGECEYLIRSTKPSGLYETLDNGLYAEIINLVYPDQIGAVANNTDCTEKLKEYFTYMCKENGVARLRGGIYLISDTIEINKSIRIVGEHFKGYGKMGTRLQTTSNKPIFEFTNDIYGLMIEKIMFSGNGGDCINANTEHTFSESFIRDCSFNGGFDKAIDLKGSITSIDNCYFANNACAINLSETYAINIEKCNFWKNEKGIKVISTNLTNINENWFEGNTIDIDFTAPSFSVNMNICENSFQNNNPSIIFDGVGGNLSFYSLNFCIDKNRFYGNGECAIIFNDNGNSYNAKTFTGQMNLNVVSGNMGYLFKTEYRYFYATIRNTRRMDGSTNIVSSPSKYPVVISDLELVQSSGITIAQTGESATLEDIRVKLNQLIGALSETKIIN